jgi:hypothetical protein
MTFKLLSRLAGAIALTVGLAGCMDVTMEMDILSETTGKATTTSVMAADVYAMMKAGASSEDNSEGFCEETGATLTENADGSATCVIIVEGAFDKLANAGTDDGAKFEVVSPGVVKVSFSTAEMKGQVGADDSQDEETKAMMQQFFEGHAITLRIKGKEVLDTNMTKTANGAEVVIPFLDLINGTVDLPPELYATVKVN